MVRLGRHLGLGQPISFAAPPFGAVSARCLAVVSPEAPGPADLVWALSRAGRRGYLILDALGALRIMSTMLGVPIPRSPRALGAAERGVVTAALSTVIRGAARNLVVSIGPGAWADEGLARVEIEMSSSRFRELVWLDVLPDWIPAATGDLREAAVARELPIQLAVELGRTTLTAGEWSRARPGDAVVFDDAYPASADGWTARLRCGELAASAVIDGRGSIRLAAGFRGRAADPTSGPDEDAGGGTTTHNRGHTMSDTERQASSSTVLASAPIEVVAEVGRLTLRADEVLALRPGSVLALGSLRPTTVDLRVADRPWARGELVNVEGQLGVRVTALAQADTFKVEGDRSDAETVRT